MTNKSLNYMPDEGLNTRENAMSTGTKIPDATLLYAMSIK